MNTSIDSNVISLASRPESITLSRRGCGGKYSAAPPAGTGEILSLVASQKYTPFNTSFSCVFFLLPPRIPSERIPSRPPALDLNF